MIKVKRFLKGTKDLYISEKVFGFIRSYEKKDRDGRPVNEVVYKLDYLARGGFVVDNKIIKHEGDGVFRIRVQDIGRIIGFYEGTDRFIAVNWYYKKTQKLNRSQRRIIKQAAETKKFNQWIYEIGG
ncbi:MAG: type II toxin-antitoxin system RelE/ParE family toxin [Nitrospirae bacterium]|nr:type II toxin-antitoxin system RelE/ParE family toxin [Nitrospirota bacterium]MBI5739556.1 type II toxin-antitoxin system RelE/ParE family toxin [Nitrospirota bacterium]